MARFSAIVSDSSDDERDVARTAHTASKSRPPLSRHDEPDEDAATSGEEDEDEEGGQESDAQTSDGTSSDMKEGELVVSRKRPPPSDALVEATDGGYRSSHGLGAHRRPHSPTSSESDDEMQVQYGDSTITPWARHVGVDAQKMHVMQTSLFHMPQEAALLKDMNRPNRPRFQLSSSVARKHSRDSDGDGLRVDSRERSSFAHDIDPSPIRPTRKFSRVDIADSAVLGTEGAIVDAGLASGRSFQVSWGPRASLAHLGQLCGPHGETSVSANSSTVSVTSIPLIPHSQQEASSRLSTLLQHHLTHTPITSDQDGVPFADPSSALSFGSFASLYPTPDRSYDASLFRLGSALFDEIKVRLGRDITIDISNRITSIRRKAALSSWLEEAVSSTVEADLHERPPSRSGAHMFTLLSGNQVDKACDVAMDSGNVKIATLISQAPGDFESKADIQEQLEIWREQRIDVHMDEDIRKIYALLAGSLDVLEGSKGGNLEQCPDVDLLKGLDWKRVFGLHLWFSEPLDSSISQVYESYQRTLEEQSPRISPPRPWYTENQQTPPFKLPAPAPPDGLFSLIRLFAEPACSLSQILTPLSFSPYPGDHSLLWHLYIIISRSMRIRDFSDRAHLGAWQSSSELNGDDISYEGHSPSADILASSYSQQLEQLGMLQEAVFVLLHIEGSAGREKAIRDLLSRSADKLDDWTTQGLLGSLRIPKAWINEAKALYAIYQGQVFDAYTLYMEAGLHQAAHDLAIADLAPEAVIRHDLELLRSLFGKMESRPINGWAQRGKALLDYANALVRIPELHAAMTERAVPDTLQEQELDQFSRSIPRLIGVLPAIFPSTANIQHRVAVSEMASRLTTALDSIRPLALVSVSVDPLKVVCYTCTYSGPID
ncbi:hypothetical protein CONPUDRAFT_156410 [Coniophora puteana RWD-64-598 SS2]|uniref:Nuclear pore complex protein NUP96 C-terminal domain-containing protein n=1 Tax=Coniophora puteana (strain RWD-64-598) TaxID=741705 RepID=A0A5M3MIE9_CONPW|nr:uncharacterized protein CONPUDRAFT_156410 [Coniophora puteana RWD-64-598 SS2]EIW78425.1 hypothetical protein CONPUDRAFT_156410 [Coniophora puteana RWD-64-598 SS2]